jgi:hypothetical protein
MASDVGGLDAAGSAPAKVPAPPDDKRSQDAAMAEGINKYLATKENSPLQGMGDVFVRIARHWGVDPRLLVAVAGAETGFGTQIRRGQNNVMNDLWNRADVKNSHFPSLERAINGGAASVRHNIQAAAPDPKKNKPAGNFYVGHYCIGPDCKNGLNNIRKFMKEQGVDPDALGYLSPPGSP